MWTPDMGAARPRTKTLDPRKIDKTLPKSHGLWQLCTADIVNKKHSQ